MKTRKVQCIFDMETYDRLKELSDPLTPIAFHVRQAVADYLRKVSVQDVSNTKKTSSDD